MDVLQVRRRLNAVWAYRHHYQHSSCVRCWHDIDDRQPIEHRIAAGQNHLQRLRNLASQLKRFSKLILATPLVVEVVTRVDSVIFVNNATMLLQNASAFFLA